jgi:hypothetical protein
MGKKRTPSVRREVQNRLLIVSPLFTITAPTCYRYISGNMQTHTKAVHTIKVLNCCSVMFKVPIAIKATMAKSIHH